MDVKNFVCNFSFYVLGDWAGTELKHWQLVVDTNRELWRFQFSNINTFCLCTNWMLCVEDEIVFPIGFQYENVKLKKKSCSGNTEVSKNNQISHQSIFKTIWLYNLSLLLSLQSAMHSLSHILKLVLVMLCSNFLLLLPAQSGYFYSICLVHLVYPIFKWCVCSVLGALYSQLNPMQLDLMGIKSRA